MISGQDFAAGTLLQGSYDYRLMALSEVIAMLASYAALDLVGRVSVTPRHARKL
jgi:NO-binding membrane sensor protein with MHYT domain